MLGEELLNVARQHDAKAQTNLNGKYILIRAVADDVQSGGGTEHLQTNNRCPRYELMDSIYPVCIM